MKLALGTCVLVLTCLGAGAAAAHHSYGMFDRQKRQNLTGVVEEFQWTNPHARLKLTAPNAAGVPETWDIEMAPPGRLVRSGWKRTAFRPGDRVSVVVSPLRDGSPGGHIVSATTVAGQTLHDSVFGDGPKTASGH